MKPQEPPKRSPVRPHEVQIALPGLLSSDKMLPIGFMPLTVQLRLTDPARACDNAYQQPVQGRAFATQLTPTPPH